MSQWRLWPDGILWRLRRLPFLWLRFVYPVLPGKNLEIESMFFGMPFYLQSMSRFV
jgi:hypothetical protein